MNNLPYSVRTTHGCRIVTGPIPLTDIAALLHAWAEVGEANSQGEWFIDAELSERMGATMVCGPRAALDHLRTHWSSHDAQTVGPDPA